MEQFRGTAVADKEIRLIALCGSKADRKDDFLNPRRIQYLILFLRRTVSLKHGCVLRSAVHRSLTYCAFNPLKTKRRLLYLKTQSVPRCKHFPSRL
jgi:hypothetical protein